MATLAELMVRVGADISDFTRSMQNVNRSMSKTGRSLMNTGKSIGEVGKKMGATVTAPIVGIGVAMIKTGADFDSQMSKVQAISGATGKQFQDLRNQAIQLGAKTSWSATQSAEAMTELASAGLSTKQIMQTLPAVLSLASAGGLDLAQSADIATSVMNGFGIQASKAQHVMDVLAQTSASSNAEISDMGEAFKYVAPVAGTLGLSLEDVSSAIGEMANKGIKGSEAGTSLRSGLLSLANPTKQTSALMQKLGMDFFDAQGKLKSMPEVIAELQQGMKGMTSQQQASTLATLFGTEAVSGWSAMVSTGSSNLQKFSNELVNSDGASQKMANTMTNNLAGAWQNFTGSIESLSISFATVLTPALKATAGFLADLVNQFNGLSNGVKTAIAIVAGLIAVISPLLVLIGFVAQGVGAFAVVFGAISTPVLVAIGALVALGVAFSVLWNQSQTFRNQVTAIFDAVSIRIKQAMTVVANFLKSKFSEIQKFWEENGSMILQAVQNVWNAILAVIKFVMPAILTIVKGVWNNVKGVINGVLNVIEGLLKVFGGVFTGNWKAVWDGVKQILSGAVQALWNLWQITFVGKTLSGISSFIKSGLSLFKSFGSALKGVFADLWNSAISKVEGFINRALGSFSGFKSSVSSIFNFIKSAITHPIETAKSIVLGFINEIKGAFSRLNIHIPHFKLPHLQVHINYTKVGHIPYPTFNVSWYKTGAIFNKPTVFGSGIGVGEAGAEAVLPIQNKRYMAPFASAVAENLKDDIAQSQPIIIEHITHTTVELDGAIVGEKVEKYVSRKQLDRQKRTNRSGR